MPVLSNIRRKVLAKILVILFVSATLLGSAAGAADAAPRAKCRNNPENYSFYKGKCLSDKRVEILKERRSGAED